MKPKKSKKKTTPAPLKVAELFAGVGGFRLGLEEKKSLKSPFKVVWSNQWEPSTGVQHASDIYTKHWGAQGHSNKNISAVNVDDIPAHDVLAGGFPCQDYSVARNLGQAHGLTGKKGVLWWEIHRILREKSNNAPSYLILENVDRLLKSPARRRGRDFALMLASLADLGYIVEWRVINAADYGMPQRRRRVFILGYKEGTIIHDQICKLSDPLAWITRRGLLSKAFPVFAPPQLKIPNLTITGDLPYITDRFNIMDPTVSPFHDAGIMVNRDVFSLKTKPNYSGKRMALKDVLIPERVVPKEYYIPEKDMPRWTYLKNSKNEKRRTKDGFTYIYTEGPIAFPDPIDKPSRTIITGEGGPTPSRFKHVIRTRSGSLRRLTPIELERLNQFPDNHTSGVSDSRRAFFMGNALVVGVVKKIGQQLAKFCNSPNIKYSARNKKVSA